MSMDKGIACGDEHRKPYRGSGKYDTSCRPNGGCPWCESNRKHGTRKREPIVLEDDGEVALHWSDDPDWGYEGFWELLIERSPGYQIVWEVGC